MARYLLLIFGALLPFAVYIADNYLLPGKFHTESPLGLHQPQLQRTSAP